MSSKQLDAGRRELIAKSIRAIPDFPKKGILFQDVTTMLLDHQVRIWKRGWSKEEERARKKRTSEKDLDRLESDRRRPTRPSFRPDQNSLSSSIAL